MYRRGLIYGCIILAGVALAIARNAVWKDELAAWNSVVLESPDKARGYIGRANAFDQLGDGKKAAEDYRTALTLDPSNLEAYANRGVMQMRQGMFDAALADFNIAIALARGKRGLDYFNRAEVFLKTARYAEAIADLDNAIRLNPNDVDAYLNRANALLHLSRLNEALADADRVVALVPDVCEAYETRAAVYGKLGDAAGGDADLQTACKLGCTQSCR